MRAGGTEKPASCCQARITATQREAVMHSIFYLIGVVVVILAVLSLVGLA